MKEVVLSFCNSISVHVVEGTLRSLISPALILSMGVVLSASSVKGDEEPMARSSWDRLHESFYTREQEQRVLGSRLLVSLNLANSASAVFNTKEAELFLGDAQDLVRDLQNNAPIHRQDSGEFVGVISYRFNEVDFKHYIPMYGDEFPVEKYESLFNFLAIGGARTVGVSLRKVAWVFDLGEVSQGIREAQRNLRTNAANLARREITKLVNDSISYLAIDNKLLEASQLLEFSRLLLKSKNIAGAQYAVRGGLALLGEVTIDRGNSVSIQKLAPISKNLEEVERILSVPPLEDFEGMDRKIQRVAESLRKF